MKVRLFQIVCSVAVAAGLSGCVTYGNTHALITPIGVAGYHTFKPAGGARDIRLPQQRDPNQMVTAKAKQERAADNDT